MHRVKNDLKYKNDCFNLFFFRVTQIANMKEQGSSNGGINIIHIPSTI